MTLRLFAPGERRNKYYKVRGRIDGELVEFSTQTLDRREAQALLKDFEKRYHVEAAIKRREERAPVTFRQAVERYAAWKGAGLRERDSDYLCQIEKLIGHRELHSLTHSDMVAVAEALHGNHKASTKNRTVVRPFGAVMHYAASNRWCLYERYPLFKQPRPRHRAVKREIAVALVAAAREPLEQLLLLWLFHQGMRITDTINIRWAEAVDQHDHLGINLDDQLVWVRIGKTDELVAQPLHPEIVERLERIPPWHRHGRLFPWENRYAVYRWLNPLAKQLGVGTFTPHMARHSLGTWLDQLGASNRTIMSALNHASVETSMRYRAGDVDIVRAAQRSLGNLAEGTR